jgi:hypothetical protein
MIDHFSSRGMTAARPSLKPLEVCVGLSTFYPFIIPCRRVKRLTYFDKLNMGSRAPSCWRTKRESTLSDCLPTIKTRPKVARAD